MNAKEVQPLGKPVWRALRLAMILASVAATNGCVRFEPRPISAGRNLDLFQSRRLDAAGLRSYLETNGITATWPLQEWDFKALTLVAFYYHPDLDLARAMLELAKAGKLTAAERPNPTLSATPSYNASKGVPTPWLVTAALDIPIETAGKRGYRIAEAGHLTEAARLNVGTVAWQVRSRLRRSLLDLYAAREVRSLLKEQQVIQTDNLILLENQHVVGAVSAFEVTQARIAADSTRLVLRDAERQQAEARVQVADALGIPSAALEDVHLSFDGLTDLPGEVPADTARRQALLNRPDILSALAEYDASQSALQQEIAKQYPDVHLGPGYEFDQGDNKWSPGISLTLPLLSRNKGPIAAAEARRLQASASFSSLQARVVGDIDRAIAACRVMFQKGQEAEAIRTHLLAQEKSARAMVEAGEISKGELIALRLQLSASALARLDALTKAQQAYQQLEDALQSPIGLPVSLWQHPLREPAVAP